eukprot:8630587-Pyramimonas_sp.AAC.1
MGRRYTSQPTITLAFCVFACAWDLDADLSEQRHMYMYGLRPPRSCVHERPHANAPQRKLT